LVTVTPRVPTGGETLTATSFSTGSGGKGANQAVACARLSRPNPDPVLQVYRFRSNEPTETPQRDITVKMIGAVGDDEFGPKLIEGLRNDGVNTDGIRVVHGEKTGVAVIIVEEDTGENRIMLSPGANHTLKPEDFMTKESLGTPLPDLIILQLEIPLPTVLQILKTAKEAGVEVLLNPAPAVKLPDEVYEQITHLIVNESEAAILAGEEVKNLEAVGWGPVMKDFIHKGAKNTVVTLGAKGAVYMSSAEKVGQFVKAEPVEKVVDTTAAGDTFVGAYAVSMVRKGRKGDVSEEDIRSACKAAGRTVETKGAQSAIPWADEVE